jgi:hypothetical protein
VPPNSWAWLVSHGCLVLGGLLIGTDVVGLALLAHAVE